MLLTCLKCDIQPNGNFDIHEKHTNVYVIPHFQGTSPLNEKNIKENRKRLKIDKYDK